MDQQIDPKVIADSRTQMAAYEMPVKSAMMNATAPMTGGSMEPPVEAAASMAAARSGDKPSLFMIGILTGPVVATSATGLPEIEP